MRNARIPLAALVIACLIGQARPATADWKWPNLNPFSAGKQPPPRSPTNEESGWRLPTPAMPKLGLPKLPRFGNKTNPPPRSRTGGKSLLTKTKEAVFPWKVFSSSDDKALPAPITGLRSSRQATPAADHDSGDSLFSSWFGANENRGRPVRSANDWLSQPRPD